MKKHLIDTTFAPEDLTSATGAAATIRASLPSLRNLNEDERTRLQRMGLRNESFSMGIIEVARLHPQAVPAGIDMAALERDIVAREQLLPLLRELQALTKLIEDTIELCGCDIFEGARALYKTLQVTGELYGLSEVIAELGRRFAMPPRKKAAPAPEAPSSGTTPTPSAS